MKEYGEAPKSPVFEYRPELGEPGPESTPVDRFGDLKRVLVTEGKRPLVSADIAGMEEMFREVMEERGFKFEVFAENGSGGGKKYSEQRANLLKVVDEETVTALEDWGERLFEVADRGTHDKSTGKTGVVVVQVVQDLYRFAAGVTKSDEKMTASERLAKRFNDRIANWHSTEKGIKNPSGCSGEIMARVIHWMQTGEMTVPEGQK